MGIFIYQRGCLIQQRGCLLAAVNSLSGDMYSAAGMFVTAANSPSPYSTVCIDSQLLDNLCIEIAHEGESC